VSDEVVELRELEPGIVQVTMCDRAQKNTFTEALIRGLRAAFQSIEQTTRFKAVILTGYDTYFSTGGTQESLLYLSEGKGTFTDISEAGGGPGSTLYSLALDCPIPVIAAMQGHGIGGGLVMGLFADFVILSRESIYATNFMRYGFTPGMGATLVVPQKLGLPLGEEMLLTARTFYGEELQKRGVPFPVLPRAEVAAHALGMARSLAEKPRLSLTLLKAHLTSELREKLPSYIERELQMHQQTFAQPEVKERISRFFRN
jgi:polyketide biosynthesis enoyl-CoA hydratase PksI